MGYPALNRPPFAGKQWMLHVASDVPDTALSNDTGWQIEGSSQAPSAEYLSLPYDGSSDDKQMQAGYTPVQTVAL